MGWNDHIDFGLHEAIEDLVHNGQITKTIPTRTGKEKRNPAYGIAQQVIDQGEQSLSTIQRETYEAIVIPALKRRHSELESLRFTLSNPE